MRKAVVTLAARTAVTVVKIAAMAVKVAATISVIVWLVQNVQSLWTAANCAATF